MAENEGNPFEDHGLYTFNRPDFARDIIFPGTRDLYNTDTLFDVQGYADRQIIPADQVVPTGDGWTTITEPVPTGTEVVNPMTPAPPALPRTNAGIWVVVGIAALVFVANR